MFQVDRPFGSRGSGILLLALMSLIALPGCRGSDEDPDEASVRAELEREIRDWILEKCLYPQDEEVVRSRSLEELSDSIHYLVIRRNDEGIASSEETGRLILGTGIIGGTMDGHGNHVCILKMLKRYEGSHNFPSRSEVLEVCDVSERDSGSGILASPDRFNAHMFRPLSEREEFEGRDVTLKVRGPEGNVLTRTQPYMVFSGPLVFNTRYVDEEASIAYIRIIGFDRETRSEFYGDLMGLKALMGRTPAGLVIDLRFNGGGELDSALRIVDFFLGEGDLAGMDILDSEGNRTVKMIKAHSNGFPYKDVPLAVLVNDETRSAAELIAGVLQERGRAVLVGTRTYGKGVIQHRRIFRKGDERIEAFLPVGRWYLPSKRCVDRFDRSGVEDPGGLAPDISVPVDETMTAKLRKRLYVPDFLRHLEKEIFDEDAAFRDEQLDMAIEVLKN